MKKFKKYTVDFTNVNYYLEMHAVIWKSLDFPDYYGCNWDAFWDCLTEMYGEPVHIEIIGLDVIEHKFGADTTRKMLDILKRYKHFCNDRFCDNIKIELVSGDVRISLQ